MSGEQVYGVTPPISVSLPTENEKRVSESLIEELRRQRTFESPSDTQKRSAPNSTHLSAFDPASL